MVNIDENLPDLSGIPEFLYATFFFPSEYGHRHISGSLNFIKNIFRIFLGQVKNKSVYNESKLASTFHGLLFPFSSS